MKIKKVLLTSILFNAIAMTSYSTIAAEPYAPYLDANKVADSLTLLPTPPAQDSIKFAADKEAYENGHSLINTDRWDQAIIDANLADNNIGKPFSEALGIEISKENTPITYNLLRNLLIDSALSATKTAKEHYMRTRPFVFFGANSCTPKDEESLRKDGSYPSGHTSYGWASALILSEIMPQRQNELLKRGFEFGQSRVICGVHWQSDVDAGRVIGAGVVARLHADSIFMEDLKAAQTELNNKLNQ